MRKWLIKLRKEREMTQLCLAERIGISRAYYAQLELAQRSPSIRVAKKMADILDFEWTLFFEEIIC